MDGREELDLPGSDPRVPLDVVEAMRGRDGELGANDCGAAKHLWNADTFEGDLNVEDVRNEPCVCPTDRYLPLLPSKGRGLALLPSR